MAKAIRDTATYKVVLAKSVRVGRRLVHPGPNVRLSGVALKALKASDTSCVTAYEEA